MSSLNTKFIFLTGGGAASLGKGLISASIGQLLKAQGFKILIQRLDPFFNVDKRTVDAALHGETFVTEDGGEVSFHLGDYERFLNEPMSSENYITAGQIYYSVIMKERRFGYGGHIVRLLPDVVEEIKSRIVRLALNKNPDVLVTEIGGSISDIDTLPFLEAARQLATELNADDVLFIHVVLVPYVKVSKRYETEGAYQSVRELRSWGIEPRVIVVRSESFLPQEYKKEIALFSNFPQQSIFESIDVESIYEIPQILHRQGLDKILSKLLNLKTKEPDFAEWNLFLQRMKSPFKICEVAVCGHDILHRNSYRSLTEALNHAAVANNIKVKVHWIDTCAITNSDQIKSLLYNLCGIIMVGEKAGSNIDGEINIVAYARTHQKPFIGINLGCHALLVEFARHVCGLKKADTQELNEGTAVPIIHLIANTRGTNKGVSTSGMRLGSVSLMIQEKSLAAQIYKRREVVERFRDLYGFNPKYLKTIIKYGLIASGTTLHRKRYDFFELKGHPFFIGFGFHPEFKSNPLSPHPIFYHFLKKAIKYSESFQAR